MGKRVALVLAGCGVFDGSEIHEASAALVHLSRGGAEVKIFAPNIEQRDVVNHLKGSPSEEKRNVLVESARLARGDIQDLTELKADEFDAVIFPGHKIAFQTEVIVITLEMKKPKPHEEIYDLLKIPFQNIHSTVKYCLHDFAEALILKLLCCVLLQSQQRERV